MTARWRRGALAGAIALLAAGPAGAQTDVVARFEETWDVGWVSVPLVVRGPGGYVDGLRATDFLLTVDGRPVPIESFETGAVAPVSVVILQDLSGSMGGPKLDASREAARHLIESARPGDRLAVAGFSIGALEVSVPFTDDREALLEAVASWEAWGSTALQDAVAGLPAITLEQEGTKRAALLITDGVDNASSIDAARARDLVRRAELPVYVLGLESGSPYALDEGRKVFRNADMLNLLAHLSGGRYFPIADPDELKEACAELIDDLRRQYVLGFSTAAEAPATHAIRVALRRPSGERRLTVRSAYQGGRPGAWR